MIRRIACVLVAAALCACNPYRSTPLQVVALGESPLSLSWPEMPGIYAVDPAQVSLILTDLSVEQFESGQPLTGQLLHVDLLWMPQAGRSPIEPEATNAAIRLLVLAEGEAGLYGGGGFAWPRGKPGDEEFAIDIVGSNLTLLAHTSGFHDLISPAAALGSFEARRDEVATRRMRRAASQFVTNRFGAVQWVGPSADGPLLRYASPR